MSFSVSGPMMTNFGLLHDEEQEDSFIAAERIAHVFPVLVGRHGARAEDAVENRSVMAAVEQLREEGGGPDSVALLPIRWRGESEASIRAQLQPVLLHYRSHILFVQERTRRRVLECEEANARVPLLSDYCVSTPPKWRLGGIMRERNSLSKADSESLLLRSPGSGVSTVSTARRNTQYMETMQRYEDAIVAQDSNCASSVRERAYSVTDYNALDAYRMVPYSPSPRAPPGHAESSALSDTLGEEEVFDSTVAYVDAAKKP